MRSCNVGSRPSTNRCFRRFWSCIDFRTSLDSVAAESDVIFIAVGTPPLPSGEANLAYLEAAARSVGAALDSSRFRVVVNKSTVPVGSANLVETLVREGMAEAPAEERRKVRFGVASNPEFLREGSAIADSLYPDRIVVGSGDDRVLDIMRELYAPLVAQTFEPPPGLPRPASLARVTLLVTSLTGAEMIKYAANAFLTMKIGYANEIANICERVGAEATEVMAGIGLDSRIGARFLNPGVGWGGSCFGKDVNALMHTAREYGYQARLLEASLEVNAAQRNTVIQKLQEKLFILKGRTIGLLGLAFKPDTEGVRYCRNAMEAVAGADALVMVTEWNEFRALDLADLAKRMVSPILVDGRNLYSQDAATAAGFDYIGVGRGARRAQQGTIAGVSQNRR